MPWLLLALSLCYVAGMYLNDAFDREFDVRAPTGAADPLGRGRRADRVRVPASACSRSASCCSAGSASVPRQGTGWPPLAAGVALAAAIVFYDWHHKDNPLSPLRDGAVPRAGVRGRGVRVVVARPPAPRCTWRALLLLSYLIGLTYVAKQEHLDRVANLWPLLFLALPMPGARRPRCRVACVAVLWLLFAAWVLYSLSFLKRRRPGDVPRAVGAPARRHLPVGCAGDRRRPGSRCWPPRSLGLFVLTLMLQRFVAPT